MKVLVIEDEPKLGKNIRDALLKMNYLVDLFDNGKEGLNKALFNIYHLIILDIMLPDINGFDILRKIRERGIETPVLLLTALDSVSDKVYGLDTGADDYLTKPFAMDELLARCRVLIRKLQNIKSSVIRISDLIIDTATREVFRNNEKILLTPKEFQILEFLAFNKNRAISRLTLAEHVWQDNFETMTNFVDVHIKNLRKKIFAPDDPKILVSIRGIGYMIKDE